LRTRNPTNVSYTAPFMNLWVEERRTPSMNGSFPPDERDREPLAVDE
jgi:hypothetical protein